MTSKAEKDRTKQIQDKCQSVLNALLRDEDNKYCVDCDSKGPRWASWNLGLFLCIRCAGIHRKLGVHISKVKSVNLDTWTPEQVVSLQQMGNSRARAVYEANLPDNFRRPQSDSTLESFIQSKYEHKKYIAREWVSPPLPKVDWEKEIDEEIDRQKRKKKSALEKKQLASVEIPQLPKPKSSSPKPSRLSPLPGITEQNTKHSADLLGLQNGDDSFTSFVSASTNNESEINSKPAENDTLKTEEESFFNQTVPTEQEKVKLTKDSILALYANAPTNSFNPNFINQGQSSFGVNQQGYQGFIGYPQPQQNLQMQNNTTMQHSNANQFQQFPGQFAYQNQLGQFPLNNQFQTSQANVQYGSQPQNFSLVNGTNFYANSQIPPTVPSNTGPVNQFQAQQPPGYLGQTPLANPFFGNASMNVQQQFGNLTLNSKTSNPGPTLATNLWQ